MAPATAGRALREGDRAIRLSLRKASVARYTWSSSRQLIHGRRLTPRLGANADGPPCRQVVSAPDVAADPGRAHRTDGAGPRELVSDRPGLVEFQGSPAVVISIHVGPRWRLIVAAEA